MPRLLAAGAIAAGALTACGGSDPKGDEESGRGSLQGSGAGAGGGTGAGAGAGGEDTPNCGVDGSSIRRLSPTPDEDVGLVLSVDGNIIFGTDAGLYRMPAQGAAAPEKILEGRAGNYFANGSQVGVIQVADDDSVQLTWVPSAGGASTSVSLPLSADVFWSYDKARNALFGITSERPLTYARHDLSSGQTEEFTTELQLRSVDAVMIAPSALLVRMSDFDAPDVTELYRVDKGTTTAVRLAPDFAQDLLFAEADDDNVYVTVLVGAGGVRAGHYSVALDGSSPPVRIEGFRGRVDSQNMYSTEQGMFGQDYDGLSFKVFPVGTAAVGETLFEYSCGTADNLDADANNIYLTVSPRSESWLLTVPR
ncbi:MAG TPA: hypothetical protein VJU61_25395 [Polyangiaceae bacterium]|nr:hypothetical protein [Polyangiaceae bacterium]